MSNLFRISCWRNVILFFFPFFLKIWDGSYGILGLTRIFPESRLQIAKSLGTCLFLMKNIFAYINRLNVCHWIKQIKLMHPPPIVSCHEGVRRFAVPLFVLLLTEVYLVDQSHKLWGEAAHQRNGEMILWRLFQNAIINSNNGEQIRNF